jgi:predicted DCC family thiol-disulfide oxidoreductase YuxK
LLYGFVIVPKFIRDGIYNFIAKNRYKWFGVREQCMMPTPEVRSRFIS